nr:MAG TPA: Baseplate component [Caudoviricetes sp.]
MEEMNTIKRDVYVLRNTIKIPIEVTKGTDAISFEFTVRDYNLPVTAAAVAYAYHRSMKKPNSLLCDISGNTISFQPGADFFEAGMNELQIRVINEEKSLISFKEKVKCSDSMGFPDEEVEEQPTLVEQILTKTGELEGAVNNIVPITNEEIDTAIYRKEK